MLSVQWVMALAPMLHATPPIMSLLSCNMRDSMTAVISSTIQLGAFRIVCGGDTDTPNEIEVPATEVETTDGYEYSTSFDPYQCTGVAPDQQSISTFSVTGLEIYFAEKEVIAGVDTFHGAHFFELNCLFEDEYDLVSSITGLDVEFEDRGDGEYVIDFTLQKVDSSWQSFPEGHVFDFKVGSPIHFSITTEAELLDFDYAPTTCSVHDKETGIEVEIFSSEMDTCGIEALDFEMNFDSDTNRWTFSFNTFSLNPYGGHNYEMRCTARLCANTGNTVCRDVLEQCSENVQYLHDGDEVETYESYELSFDLVVHDWGTAGYWGSILQIGSSFWDRDVHLMLNHNEKQSLHFSQISCEGTIINHPYPLSTLTLELEKLYQITIRNVNGAGMSGTATLIVDGEELATHSVNNCWTGGANFKPVKTSNWVGDDWNNLHESADATVTNIVYKKIDTA